MSKKQPRDDRVKVALSKVEREKATRAAKREGRSLSNWIARLVSAALDAA